MRSDAAPIVLLYDAGCNFCLWMVAAVVRRDHDRALRPLAIQSAEAQPLLADLDDDTRLASWHAVDAHGHRTSGGDALPVVLGAVPALAPLAALSRRLPAGLRRWGYRLVAERRVQLSRFVPRASKDRARARVEALS